MLYNTIYENILNAIQSVSPKIFFAQTIVNGLECDLYYPLASESVYNSFRHFNYPATPDVTRKKLIITGIHQEIFEAPQMYDAYLADPPIIWTLEADHLPQHTKVVVYLGQRTFNFEIENKIGVAGVNTHIFIKHFLRPNT